MCNIRFGRVTGLWWDIIAQNRNVTSFLKRQRISLKQHNATNHKDSKSRQCKRRGDGMIIVFLFMCSLKSLRTRRVERKLKERTRLMGCHGRHKNKLRMEVMMMVTIRWFSSSRIRNQHGYRQWRKYFTYAWVPYSLGRYRAYSNTDAQSIVLQYCHIRSALTDIE